MQPVLTTELSPAQVTDFINALDKAVRSRRLYAPNNPTYLTFLNSAKEKCAALWNGAYSLSVVVDENGFKWENQTFSAGECRSAADAEMNSRDTTDG